MIENSNSRVYILAIKQSKRSKGVKSLLGKKFHLLTAKTYWKVFLSLGHEIKDDGVGVDQNIRPPRPEMA